MSVASSSDGTRDGIVASSATRLARAITSGYSLTHDTDRRKPGMGKVEVSNTELRTVRNAMRELNRMVDALESGESEKFVLTQRNQMRAVVISVDAFSAMQQRALERG
jgi:hypothetical protein